MQEKKNRIKLKKKIDEFCNRLGLCFSPQNILDSLFFVCFTHNRNAGMMGTLIYLQKACFACQIVYL